MNWAKIGQISKIREEIQIKGVESWKNLEKNSWMMSILEDLGEF